MPSQIPPYPALFFSVVLLAAPISGCSASKAGLPAPAAESAAAGDSSSESKEVPIEVAIGHAFEDAENLNVKVVLTAKTDLDPKTVAVSLLGLNDGEVRQEDTKLLADEFSGETFEAGTTLAVLFKLNRRDLTEYQVKVGWGTDAQDLAKKILGPEAGTEGGNEELAQATADDGTTRSKLEDPSILEDPPVVTSPVPGSSSAATKLEDSITKSGAERLTLENLKTDQTTVACKNPPCDRRYVVSGELVNQSDSPITGARLGLGLYWVESSGHLSTPADGTPLAKNEEEIDLSSMQLEPGVRRKIRVTVDRSIPVVPGGEFLAHLRIVSFGPK